jgi:hypothetical protein
LVQDGADTLVEANRTADGVEADWTAVVRLQGVLPVSVRRGPPLCRATRRYPAGAVGAIVSTKSLTQKPVAAIPKR